MDSTIFCVLCGGPFDLEPHIYNIDPDTETFQWIYDVRLLSNCSAPASLNMTSLEEEPPNASGSDDVFLSESTRWTSTDAEYFPLGNSYYHVLNDDYQGDVIFPLHYACIQIGCRVIGSQSAGWKGVSPLARLNGALRSRFHHRKYFGGGVGHDLFDLYAEYSNYGPRSLLAVDELGWWGDTHEKFLADPIKIPDLTSFLFSAVQATPQYCSKPSQIFSPAREPRGLESFPNELLDQITEFLSPVSIIALHRTSRSFAQKVPLNNRFWRNHILDGSLLPHIWDLTREQFECPRDGAQQRGSWGWKSLAKLLFKKEFPICGRDSRLDGMPPGFWNRCRIWRIVEEACLVKDSGL